jgi:hypothetical protein
VHDPTRAHPHETTDHDQRPVRLPSPSGNAFTQVADAGAVAAQGPVGSMAGLPVYLDPNIAINTGTGSNQDSVLVMKADDLYLWETSITMATFEQPYSDSMGVLFRVHGYSAMIASRFPASIAVISGTGLVTPTY